MTLALYDRVQQTGTANTTVSFTLSGSVAGYQSFVAVGNGNTTYYGSFDTSGNWEVGLGTYSTTGPTLTRTTILSSSNGGLAVTFSGTVNVFITYPSEKSVNQDANGNVGIGTSSPSVKLEIVGDEKITTSTNTGGLTLTGAVDNTGLAIISTNTNGATWKLLSTAGASGYGQGALAFERNSSLKMLLDSSGNVGINTTTPTTYLNVNGNASISTTAYYGSTFTASVSGTGAAGSTSALQLVSFTSGTPTPCWASLHVVPTGGGYRSGLTTTYSADGNGGYCAWNQFNPSGSSTTEVARFDYNGDLLVGTTANIYGSRLNVKSNNDNVAAEFYRQGTTTGSGIVVFSSNSGGTETLKSYIDVSTGALTLISDERVKENIANINYGLNQINALRPVSFEWKQGDGATNLGFIAQEVETIIPEAVTTLDKSMSKTIPNQKMLNKDSIIPVLVKAIQELNAKVTALEAQLGAK